MSSKGFDLSKTYKTNKKSETEGVWEDLGDGAKILVARLGNDLYQESFRRIPRAVQQQITNRTLSSEKTDDIINKLIAETILLDWDGLSDEGKAIKYSPENALNMLRKYPDFKSFVWDLASDMARFRAEEIADTIKN